VATATATLTSTGSLTAPKPGDVLDYRVVFSGDTHTLSITPGSVTDNGQPVTVTGGPWTFTVVDPETVGPPNVAGGTLSKPFAQDPTDPRHWQGTF
jgi:hypothetical protein